MSVNTGYKETRALLARKKSACQHDEVSGKKDALWPEDALEVGIAAGRTGRGTAVLKGEVGDGRSDCG
jgi:hypothetical protein